jgi:hypothetical protein
MKSLFHLRLVQIIFLLSLPLFLARCGNNKTVEPTFTSLHENFFASGGSSCGRSSCHQTGTQAYASIKLDMNTDKSGVYTALKSTSIQNLQNAECDGIPLVKASDWDGSLLKAMAGSETDRTEFAAAHGNCSPSRFSTMFGSVDEATLAALKKWVNDGAQNN